MTAAIGFVLLGCGGIACWYAGADTRSGERAALPAWLRRHGRRLALAGLLLQLALSAWLLGAATGPLLVAVAWMTVGCLFVACVNAWPAHSVRLGLVLGVLGAVALAVSLF